MISRLLGAVQFLTIAPVPWAGALPGECAIFFPIVGALLGLFAGAVCQLLSAHVGPQVSALLAVGWLMLITGCLHEDGLADVADAFRSGRSREKIMLILKDSRVGTYGAVALIFTIVLRWQALAACRIDAWRGLTGALALSRTSMVCLAGVTHSVGGGLGKSFARGCSTWVMVLAVLQAVAICLLAGWRPAIVMLLGNTLLVWGAKIYFTKRLGGINGDCLGATCQLVETFNLVVLAWHSSI